MTLPIRNLRPTIPTNPAKPYRTRPLAAITGIIVHHSLTKTGSAAAYARYHISEYGWSGIAYHYVIDPDGTVNETLDWEKIGNHCAGMNTRTLGIVLTGNFDKTDPTPAQLEALAQLITRINNEIGRPLTVERHSDHSKKTCPGIRFPWLELMDTLRLLEYVPAPPTPDDEMEEPTVPIPPEAVQEDFAPPPAPAAAPEPAPPAGCLGIFFRKGIERFHTVDITVENPVTALRQRKDWDWVPPPIGN